MNHTLYTWQQNDLLSHVGEIIFFLNGVRSADDFTTRLPYLREPPWQGLIRVVPSPENLKLGLAINRMVELAKYDYVLLLEKDWALIEPTKSAHTQLQTAINLLDRGTAHVVRYRHRKYPGAPLHARMMHENRETQMLQQQSNLYCYVHHWVDDPTINHSDYLYRCEGTALDEKVWCSKAKFCQWTNNPGLFKRTWFLDQLGRKFVKDYNEIKSHDPNSGMLDFEFYTNWKGPVWNDREFVVALPVGLFEHEEVGEQNLMNTVWYAWNRLKVDVEEKSRDLLNSERKECQSAAKTLQSGATFAERFPIDFVRHYSYNQSMLRTTSEGVTELHENSVAFAERLEKGHGTWRNGITDLTNLWYKVCLFVYPTEPKDMKIAFVTAFYRTEVDSGSVAANFDEEVTAAAANLNALSNYKLIVYTSEEEKTSLTAVLRQQHLWDETKFSTVDFVVQPLDDFLKLMLSPETVERIQSLREGEEWQNVSKERSEGAVPSFHTLSLGMAKPYILDHAVHHSEKSSDPSMSQLSHLVWFDPTSGCVSKASKAVSGGPSLSPQNDHVLRAHMMLHILITGVKVSDVRELESMLDGSGFAKEVLLREMQKKGVRDLHLVDMKTIGGSKLAIGLMKGYYDVVLRNTMRMKQLGTGREAMTIAWNNVQYNFRFFDGFSGCSKSMLGEHSCGAEPITARYMSDKSAGCKLYEWAGECAPSR